MTTPQRLRERAKKVNIPFPKNTQNMNNMQNLLTNKTKQDTIYSCKYGEGY